MNLNENSVSQNMLKTKPMEIRYPLSKTDGKMTLRIILLENWQWNKNM